MHHASILRASLANLEMKLIDRDIVDAISQAAGEIREGLHHEYFRVDMIQGGAGDIVEHERQ